MLIEQLSTSTAAAPTTYWTLHYDGPSGHLTVCIERAGTREEYIDFSVLERGVHGGPDLLVFVCPPWTDKTAFVFNEFDIAAADPESGSDDEGKPPAVWWHTGDYDRLARALMTLYEERLARTPRPIP